MTRNKYFVFIIILFLIYLVFTLPFWTGEIFKNVGDFPNRQINIPQEYYQLSKSLNENKLDSVIFPVPIIKIGMGSFWWNNGKDGYASVYPFIYMLSSKRTFYVDFELVNDDNLSKIITDKKYIKFLGFQNVSTLIFHNDSNWKTVNGSPYWYPNDKNSLDQLQERIKGIFPGNIKSIGSLTAINIITDKPNYFLPHLYTADKTVVSDGNIKDLPDIVSRDTFDIRTAILFKNQNSLTNNLKEINATNDSNRVTEFKNINPTKYRVIIHQASKPFMLVFNEQYHPDWRPYLVPTLPSVGSLVDHHQLNDNSEQATNKEITQYLSNRWLTLLGDSYISKNYQGTIQNDNLPPGNLFETLTRSTVVTSANHFLVNGYANGWIIDPAEVCQKNKKDFCVKNSNGTYDISLIIEFWPQRLFYLGSAISTATLLICFIYIFKSYHRVKKPHEK